MTSLTRKTIYAFAVAILLAATPAFAADVDGKWSGTISVAGVGDVPVSFEFKADGATLTGSTQSLDGMSVNIKDGKIDGDKITFLVSLDLGGMPLDITYSGVVTPAELKMKAEVVGMTMDFVVKKEK